MDAEVLLVDDVEHLRTAYAQTLELASIKTRCFAGAEGVLESIGRLWCGVIITDIKMPGISGLDLMEQVLAVDPDLPVILITGHGDVPMAVAAMRKGAYDFIEKPFESKVIIGAVHRALEKRRLVLENRQLRTALEHSGQLDSILIGRHEQTRQLREQLISYAATDADVLILGETGTGKELAARSLHDLSPRAAGRFVPVNCGALPGTIIESELFGHEAGAFTGAIKSRVGKFEHAAGGSLFLDEIESMPVELQIRLLRVLQERVVVRLGSNEEKPVDVRVIAASKSDLLAAAEQGDFREDLFFRLNVLCLRIPPLREHIDDAPLLFQHFLHRAARRYARDPVAVTPAVTASLLAHDWPQNVRELHAVIEQALIETGGTGALRLTDALAVRLKPPPQAAPAAVAAPREGPTERPTADQLRARLAALGGNIKALASELGIARTTLYRWLRAANIDPDSLRGPSD